MSDTKKVQEVRGKMAGIFGPTCWMGYKLDRKNPFTYHMVMNYAGSTFTKTQNIITPMENRGSYPPDSSGSPGKKYRHPHASVRTQG